MVGQNICTIHVLSILHIANQYGMYYVSNMSYRIITEIKHAIQFLGKTNIKSCQRKKQTSNLYRKKNRKPQHMLNV